MKNLFHKTEKPATTSCLERKVKKGFRFYCSRLCCL